MKRILFLTLIMLGATGALWAQEKTGTIEIKASIYCDHCKKCESCGTLLEEAVYAVKGVRRVDINDQSMTMQIAYNPKKTGPDQIRKAITAAGYDADNLKADPEAYRKLDDCCKKQ